MVTKKVPPKKKKSYHLYILGCADGTLYTGIAVDLLARIRQHSISKGQGAKYTRSRRPVKLLYTKSCLNRSGALREEAKIKKLSRLEKLNLIQSSSL